MHVKRDVLALDDRIAPRFLSLTKETEPREKQSSHFEHCKIKMFVTFERERRQIGRWRLSHWFYQLNGIKYLTNKTTKCSLIDFDLWIDHLILSIDQQFAWRNVLDLCSSIWSVTFLLLSWVVCWMTISWKKILRWKKWIKAILVVHLSV